MVSLMKITILCSDASHPVNEWLERWVAQNSERHSVEIIRDRYQALGGDILFLVSCNQVVDAQIRALYQQSLVIHASDLPKGRGWSPHIWQIVGGAQEITLTLLEAADKVDSGRIWAKTKVAVPRVWLYDEINRALFDAELKLMDLAVTGFRTIKPIGQNAEVAPTYYSRRTPEYSRIDPNRSISEQFDKIRVCDPVRFPAFFEIRGCKYKIIIERY